MVATPTEIERNSEFNWVTFSLSNNPAMICSCDIEVYDKIVKPSTSFYIYKRKKHNIYYIRRHIRLPSGKMKTEQLHNLVMGPTPEGKVVDHIKRNGLLNRRGDLRFVTPTVNRRNSKDSKSKEFYDMEMGYSMCSRMKGKYYQLYYFNSETKKKHYIKSSKDIQIVMAAYDKHREENS